MNLLRADPGRRVARVASTRALALNFDHAGRSLLKDLDELEYLVKAMKGTLISRAKVSKRKVDRRVPGMHRDLNSRVYSNHQWLDHAFNDAPSAHGKHIDPRLPASTFDDEPLVGML
jgi:hypothetical protein